MANKIWLKNYPVGMPAEVDVEVFTSIPDMFEKTAAKFADRPAFHNLGHTLRYAELERLSRHFAAFLQALPGMAKGDRVAIMAPNLLQYPVALFGILRAGMTVVNVNPLYTPRELQHQLADAGARAVVIRENFASSLQQVLARTPVEHVITTQVGDLLPTPKRWLVNLAVKRVKRMVPEWHIEGAIPFRTALARGAAATLTPADLTREDLAFLQYTGGTTGVSKGAMLTHGNILANLEQTGVWVSGSFKEGADGVISVEEAKGTETTLEVVEGMQFDRGYLSPYFVTDAERMKAVLEELTEAGIIDATKVVRTALENAVSVASVLLLTEATMTEIPKPEPATPRALDENAARA